jgi:hypothetical protein
LEDLPPESGFCWKKDCQDTIFQKIRKFQKNTKKLYFTRRLKKPEGGVERSYRAGSHTVDGFSPSSWEPQEEGMMSTAASFSLNKKPRYVESRKKPNSRR